MNIEQKLDAEFARLGVRPYIYHITFEKTVFMFGVFRAITVALPERRSWSDVEGVIREGTLNILRAGQKLNLATYMRWYLKEHGIYGVAICDPRDPFKRQLGRVIAKGRLLKHLQQKEQGCEEGEKELRYRWLLTPHPTWIEKLRVFIFRRKFIYCSYPMPFSNGDMANVVSLNNHCMDFEDDLVFTRDDGETILNHKIVCRDASDVPVFWIHIDGAELGARLFIYYGRE